MPRFARLLVLALPASLFAFPAARPADVPAGHEPDPRSVQRYQKATRYTQAGWVVLHIEGGPYDRGYQHGRLMAAEIADYVATLARERYARDPAEGWRAVRTLVSNLERAGMTVVRGRIVNPDTSVIRALRTEGGEVAGDRFVFACGAWLPGIFPDLLKGRIRPSRQVVAYFGTPAGDARFAPSRFPAWIDFPSGVYGTPDIDGRGVKVGIDTHGGAIDPDTDDRLPDAASLQRARDWLAQRIPALAGAPIAETRVCAY